jgi:MFS family permease
MSGALFTLFTVGCAVAPSIGVLVAFRLLAGMAGGTPLTIGGGIAADMVAPNRRGTVMAIFTLGMLLGPILGPPAGGFLSQAKGWRWMFWVLTISVRPTRQRASTCFRIDPLSAVIRVVPSRSQAPSFFVKPTRHYF